MLPPTRGNSLPNNQKKSSTSNIAKTGPSEPSKDSILKKSFQFQLPHVMASLTAKVAQKTNTLRLPQVLPRIEIMNKTTPAIRSANLKYGQHPDPTKYNADYLRNSPVPECYYDYNIPETKPRLSGKQKPYLTGKIAPPLAPNNRAAKYLAEESKSYEIPLEESLKAVEDFIKREKVSTEFKVGEIVLAKWKGNGMYYKAEILDMFTHGTALVEFDSYDETDEVDCKDLSKYFKKTNGFKKKGRKTVTEPPKEVAEAQGSSEK